jgi:AcrR family transcriptional regulator
MSRVRPTKEQTRERLVEVALVVFARQGIGGTSVEDIVSEAGYSRGAFYSSFGSMDELVLEVMEDIVGKSIAQLDAVLVASTDPEAFLVEMRLRGGSNRFLPAGASGTLMTELALYAVRNPENRPRLAERLRRFREVTARILLHNLAAAGVEPPMPIDDLAAMILAMDDGLGLHEMLDPERYSGDMFWTWMLMLQQITIDLGEARAALAAVTPGEGALTKSRKKASG